MKIKAFIGVTCMILTMILVCGILTTALSKPKYDFEAITYIVKDGDNLWGIASDYCPNEMDKRDYIDLVIERNNLSNSVIYPGQRLVVYKSQN